MVPSATALTSSTSSESSSIEIIERSSDASGFFLHDADQTARDDSQHSSQSEQSFTSAAGYPEEGIPPSPSPFQLPDSNTLSYNALPHYSTSLQEQSYSTVVDNINQLNISTRRHANSAPSGGIAPHPDHKLLNTSQPTSPVTMTSSAGNMPTSSSASNQELAGRNLTQSLELLREMGFTDTDRNRALLTRGSQSIDEVVLQLSEAGANSMSTNSM